MRWIRILDNEEAYARNLGTYLEKRLSDCRVVVGEQAPADGEQEESAVVAGSGYRDWAGAADCTPVLRLAPWICRDSDGEDTTGVQGPGRLGSAREIADALERMMAPSETGYASKAHIAGNAHVTGLLTDVCDRMRKVHIDHMFSSVIEAGGRAVYFPLLPAHRMACAPMSRAAGTLTQLLLRAMSEDLDDTVLGNYLHPARSGVLCIQPAESHEHLLQCGADCLRRVMGLLGRWMEHQPAASLAIIDLSELPEDTIAAVLSMCDEFLLLNGHPDGGRYGFHERIGPLIARLPARCRVARINIVPNCRSQEARAGTIAGKSEETV